MIQSELILNVFIIANLIKNNLILIFYFYFLNKKTKILLKN